MPLFVSSEDKNFTLYKTLNQAQLRVDYNNTITNKTMSKF